MLLVFGAFANAILISSSIILLLFPLVAYSKSNETFAMPSITNPVGLDGRWSTRAEWADASEAKIVHDGQTAYLRAKHDERFVYVMIDYVSDKGLERGDGRDLF